MQSLDDDMEDLFRRAGEDYPLKTDGSNWQKVQQALNATDGDTPATKKHDYRAFWLLLLLPFAFICGRYTGTNSSADKTVEVEKNSSGHAGKEAVVTSKNKAGITIINKGNASTFQPNAYLPKSADASGSRSKDNEHPTATIEQAPNETNKIGPFLENERPKKGAGLLAGEPSRVVAKMDLLQPGASPGRASNEQVANDIGTDKRVATEVLKVDTAATTPLPQTPKIVAENPAGKVAKANKKEPGKKGWYYGLTVAPDISTVKFKQADKLGYSAGILLGYQTGKRVRVETGLLWSNKNYFTDGEYLDTANLKLPRHSKVLQAKGSCNMFEIPVAIQYDVYSGAKHNVFVAASVHSYLMKREDYDITYNRYNVNYSSEYSYRNSTNNWFAVAGFSAGYRTAFGKKGFIGFAPYIKLPLKGLGVGKLPISSTGLNITVGNFLR